MTIQEQIKYWLDSAEHDLIAAENLFDKGNYDWCLFIGHLILEKALKALYVQKLQAIPPRIHDLLRLAKACSLSLSKDQELFLFQANGFNMEARYPDEKLAFYKLCTKDFATENLRQIKEMYVWLKSQI